MIEKIDVIVPTKNVVNNKLFSTLKSAKWVNNLIITKEKPLSLARKNALLKTETKWVAMFDDDVVIPENWFLSVSKEFKKNVGAITTVAEQNNVHERAYDKVVGCFVRLEKLETSPHINNVLVRKELFVDYNPPALFFGEDLYFREHVEKKGCKWVVLPYIGVEHLGENKNFISTGRAYRKHYSKKQLLRRVVARFVFAPYASMVNFDLKTFFILTKQNVQFIAGWLKR